VKNAYIEVAVIFFFGQHNWLILNTNDRPLIQNFLIVQPLFGYLAHLEFGFL
jgi:hypothetical protein|tara:strand:+ start:836 stop:991 length:156 start_codon:yes stop_codon:yes gene_type:complete